MVCNQPNQLSQSGLCSQRELKTQFRTSAQKVNILCIDIGGLSQRQNKIRTCELRHETSAPAWCTGKTQRDRVEREVGGGIGMGNTCKSMADSCQCRQKPLQYYKVISLQLIKINEKKKDYWEACSQDVLQNLNACLYSFFHLLLNKSLHNDSVWNMVRFFKHLNLGNICNVYWETELKPPQGIFLIEENWPEEDLDLINGRWQVVFLLLQQIYSMKYRKLFIREVKNYSWYRNMQSLYWYYCVVQLYTKPKHFGITNIWNLYVAFDCWTIYDVIRQVLLTI